VWPWLGVRVNGPADDAKRLPNTLSVGVRGLSASVLLAELSEQVAASAGAACHTGEAAASISSVLLAMRVPEAGPSTRSLFSFDDSHQLVRGIPGSCLCLRGQKESERHAFACIRRHQAFALAPVSWFHGLNSSS